VTGARVDELASTAKEVPPVLRKILGVIAGYSAWSVLWFVSTSTAAAVSSGSFGDDGSTSTGMLLVFLALSVVFSLFAGWLATMIGGRGRGPAVWTGVLLLATGIPVQFGYWSVIPLWYHLPFLALLLPAAYLGGSIRRTPTAQSPAKSAQSTARTSRAPTPNATSR
jgi:hypothetical protein